MPYESLKYYNGNLYATYMQVLQKMLKINNYLQNLYAGIAMDVKKTQQLFTKPICKYYNGCKKTSYYLQDLYVGIAYLK
jgi:hypothetical protein